MNIHAVIAADQRLRILQALEADADYQQNEDVLQGALRLSGHDIDIDKQRTEVAWLESQGYVTVEKVRFMTVVKITRQGADVAKGRKTVPGVARPGPEG